MARWAKVLAMLAAAAVLAGPAAAERRLALVIGNDTYQTIDDLSRAVADARAMAGTLTETGFEAVLGENTTRREFNRKVLEFTGRLQPGDLAFFFYAGHGVEIDGRNFLLPTDTPEAGPGQERFVEAEAIAVDDVLGQIREAGARVSILVLDACRDNPFAREGTRGIGASRGLARMAAPAGTFIMYSAGVGQSALDRLGGGDDDANSVFTRSLIPLLRTPGLSLTETARRVRQDVEKLARSVAHEQRPAYYDEVTGDVFLAGRGGAEPPRPAPAPAPAPSANAEAAEAWAAIQATDSEAVLETFIASFKDTVYARFAAARLEELRRQAALAPTPTPAPAPPQTRTVSYHYLVGLDPKGDNWLALRSAPSGRGQRLAKMGPQTLLEVVGQEGAWLEVVVRNTQLAGRRGWAHGNYIACCQEVAVAAPGEAAPAGAAPQAAAVPEQQLLAFVREVYLPASGGLEAPSWAFAPSVDYYGQGPTSRDAVLRDKASYYSKWPTRSYTLLPQTFQATPRGGAYDVSFEYRFAVTNATSRLSGRGISYLTLVPEGGSFQIARENGDVLERD